MGRWGDGDDLNHPISTLFHLGHAFPSKQGLGCLFFCLLSVKAVLKGALNPTPFEIRPNYEPLEGPELFDLSWTLQ